MILPSELKLGVLVLRFRLRHARSLKDKRSLVGKIRERAKSRFNVSVAEVEGQDDLRRLVIAFSVVGANGRELQSVLDRLSAYVDGLHLAEIVSADVVVDSFGHPDKQLTRQHF